MEQYGNMAMFTSYLAPGHSRGGPTGASAIEQWAHITGALFEQLYVPASTWGKWDFSLFVLALQTNQKYKKSDFNGILMWFTEKSESNTFKSGLGNFTDFAKAFIEVKWWGAQLHGFVLR